MFPLKAGNDEPKQRVNQTIELNYEKLLLSQLKW